MKMKTTGILLGPAILTVVALLFSSTGYAGTEADSFYQKALAQYNAGDYNGAKDYGNKAVQSDPYHWQAWQMIGNAEYAQGDKQAALKAYDQSLLFNPENPQLRSFVEQIKGQTGSTWSPIPEAKAPDNTNYGATTPRENRRGRRDDGVQYTGSRKKPGLAFLFSFLVPGLGQYYNGGGANIAKGAIQEVLCIGGVVVAFAAGIDEKYVYNPGYSYWNGYSYSYYGGYSYSYEEYNPIFYAGMTISGLSSVWSMIDAPLSAASRNRRLERSSMGLSDSKYALGLTVGPMGDKIGGKLSFYF